jgi:hypothetical protein
MKQSQGCVRGLWIVSSYEYVIVVSVDNKGNTMTNSTKEIQKTMQCIDKTKVSHRFKNEYVRDINETRNKQMSESDKYTQVHTLIQTVATSHGFKDERVRAIDSLSNSFVLMLEVLHERALFNMKSSQAFKHESMRSFMFMCNS